MHTISPALLAAATSRRGRPLVTLDVEDRQTRFHRLATGAASTRLTDLDSAGSTLWRAVISGTTVRVARLTNPAEPAAWPGAWVTAAAGADGAEDVALAALDALRASVFYRDLAGALARADTSDGGATWSAPVTLTPWDHTPTHIAAAGRVCAYAGGGEVRLAVTRDALGGPAWLPAGLYTGAGAFSTCRGLALCVDGADPSTYHLLAALDGALYHAPYHEPSRTFGDTRLLAPAGTALAPGTSRLRLPSAAWTAEGLYVSLVDGVGSGGADDWQHTVILRATPGALAACRVALLDMGQPSATRAALACVGGDLYAAYEHSVCLAPGYSAADPARNLRGLLPIRYTLHADEGGSTLRVRLTHREGWGAPGGAVRPLARVSLRRGYATAAGAETVPLPAHYLVEASATAGAAEGTLEIVAVDGWGLLERVRPADVATWEGATIRECLAAVLALAGLDYADAGEPALGRAVERLVLRPDAPLAPTVRALLALAGAVAVWDEAGTLQARVLADHAPGPAVVGAAGELLEGRRTVALPGAAWYRVYGEGALASAADAGAGADGLLLTRGVVEGRATSVTLAGALAAYLARREGLTRDVATLRVPLRPDLALWDLLEVEGARRRLVGLEETWDAALPRYDSRLLAALEP